MKSETQFERERQVMVTRQIEQRGIRDPRLLEAFRSVPRHLFVPKEQRYLSYQDFPLHIGQGQTISQPYIVALMTSLLELSGSENVLEIGTGSGYQAALLGRLADSVHTVERHEELASPAREALRALALNNVFVHVSDGSMGWPEAAPYHCIIVTAAAPRPPRPLLDQLAEGGRLVLPVGDRSLQELQVWRRHGSEFTCKKSIPVAFVPLRGEYGWDEKDWS